MLIFSGLVSLFLLILSVINNVYLGYPLSVSLVLLCLSCLKKGKSPKEVLKISLEGGKKSFSVITILMMIGAMTALWMASGTVGTLVNYSITLINPKLFILSAFLLSCGVSFLIGTSFGTASTIGVVLMVIAVGGGVNPYITCGAIISGIYFGDRASPMSSSLNLLSTLSDTDHFDNVKVTLKSSVVPMILSTIAYLVLSFQNPIDVASSSLSSEIAATFEIGIVSILPAIAIMVLCFLRVNIKISMTISIITSLALALLYQSFSISEVINTIVYGFSLPQENPLSSIIRGGGLVGMIKTSYIVFVACAIAGLFEKGGLLSDDVEKFLSQGSTPVDTYIRTVIVAIISSCLGCNQAIAIVITTQTMNRVYGNKGISKRDLVRDLSQTAVLIPPIIPWNISVMIPVATMGLSGIGYMPYIFYLYLSPIYNFFYTVYKNRKLTDAHV